jgi:hypothetical protein
MKIRIKVDAQAGQLLNQMAAEANLSVEDLAEVAVYNVIGLWQAEKTKPPETSIIVTDSTRKLVLPTR